MLGMLFYTEVELINIDDRLSKFMNQTDLDAEANVERFFEIAKQANLYHIIHRFFDMNIAKYG